MLNNQLQAIKKKKNSASSSWAINYNSHWSIVSSQSVYFWRSTRSSAGSLWADNWRFRWKLVDCLLQVWVTVYINFPFCRWTEWKMLCRIALTVRVHTFFDIDFPSDPLGVRWHLQFASPSFSFSFILRFAVHWVRGIDSCLPIFDSSQSTTEVQDKENPFRKISYDVQVKEIILHVLIW